jgi:hypothetical protein
MAAADKIHQYRALKAEVQVLLNDVGASLVDLLDNAAEEEAHRNIDQSIHGYFQSYYDLRTRHDQDGLQVAVLALTKSGEYEFMATFKRDAFQPRSSALPWHWPQHARVRAMQGRKRPIF